jgi:hypothetical protein
LFVIAAKYSRHLVVKQADNKGGTAGGICCRRAGAIEKIAVIAATPDRSRP